MKLLLPISPLYFPPMRDGVVIQMIFGLLCGLILDGGVTASFCGIALAAFWGGAVFVLIRRPQSPTRWDLELMRFGFLVVFALTVVLAPLVADLREWGQSR
jgi:hypothetical protein